MQRCDECKKYRHGMITDIENNRTYCCRCYDKKPTKKYKLSEHILRKDKDGKSTLSQFQ